MAKPIVVGFDFDGVIAYNPARLARYPISLFKTKVLGIQKVSFFVPKNSFERALWALGHETSVVPAIGTGLLKSLVKQRYLEAHLVSARFGYLRPNLERFLRRWNLDTVFSSITLNEREEQPHEFKKRVISEHKFRYYVEDNWDIVSYLSRQNLPTEIHWIYNIFDRNTAYPHKFPYLKKSVQYLVKP